MISNTIIFWLPKGSVNLNRKGSYTIKTLNCIPQYLNICRRENMEIAGILGIIISTFSFFIAVIALIQEMLHSRQILKLEKDKIERDEAEKIMKQLLKVEDEKRKLKNLKNYRRKITQDFEYINLGGLKNPSLQFLPLEKIYVKQRVEYIPPSGMPKSRNLRTTIKRSQEKFENFETEFGQLQKDYKDKDKSLKLIIQGPAGSGKTTLLKWIALQCNRESENSFSRFIPIFICLKDLARDPDHSFRTHNLRKLTIHHISATNIKPSFFDDAFENDQLIFLFDGLDEIPDKNILLEVLDWLQSQNTGGNPMVVTTRLSKVQKYRDLNYQPSILVYNLQEFTPQEIKLFIENWFNNIEAKIVKEASGEETGKINIKMKQKCMHLTKIIETNERLLQLAANPMILTIISILQIHRDQSQLTLEQQKIYEDCLKLVIELKENEHSQPEPGFPIETCIEYLSYIAFNLTEYKTSEIELSKIKEFLPVPIEDRKLDYFLKEMTQKTGLLYESKDKYGFSHVTFQEYLAARYFAREKRPKDILEYRNKDYFGEIFKLYVNIACHNHILEFFDIIVDNLEKKEYWKQLSLWEDCLLNIPDKDPQNEDENTRYKIEIQFAKKILNLLHQLSYKKVNEELIISLYPHYPLYLYAIQFIDDAWDLCDNAKHPFTQSIASTILHSCDKSSQADITEAKSTKAELINQLKNRIDNFEKQKDKTQQAYIDFILQNSNTFPLILASRKNILDFSYGIEKLKSDELFFNFLILHTLESIVDTLSTGEVLKLLALADLREILEFLKVKRFLRQLDLTLDIELLALRDFLKLEGFMKLRIDMGDIRLFIEHRYFDKLRGMVNEYENLYRPQLVKLKKEINTWVDSTTAKLHQLTDQKISKYFPGTTEEDIKKFRDRTK